MSDLKLFFCPPHPFIISKLIPTHTESQTGKHTTQGSGDLNYGYVPDALRLLLPLIPPYFWLDIIKSAAAYSEVSLCFSFYLLSNQSHISSIFFGIHDLFSLRLNYSCMKNQSNVAEIFFNVSPFCSIYIIRKRKRD